ncbi:hypothetical protein [Sphingomonas xinjiangensis]|uniref:Uncharacterized protein n=1 Tax=Sphingomonas xinjiangensis TaxID=643568 RepID=A0A840YN65_9SPHN|nr:hypothetical protein [Sphingomonas xinjiangensis]MBB5711566.1 hypothetical protein [Sphingomonas xinjiangensis]
MPLPALTLFALFLALPLQESDPPEADPAQVSEVDAINCRLNVPSYTGFAMSLGGKDGIARKRGWKQVGSGDGFLLEYQLPAPITVAGHRTQRVAFSGDSILAILDVPDPAVLAGPEQITNDFDIEPMIAELVASGKATRAQIEAEFKFRKFGGERILKEETEAAGEGESFGSHMMVARTITNAATHPGKTLYGCAYRMEVLDKDGAPL